MRRPASARSHVRLKLLVSAIALAALVVRIAFPDLGLDAVSLGLLALAVLPWLSPLIKSAELPGGVKIEFQDVAAAAQKVATGSRHDLRGIDHVAEPSFVAIAEQDPSLALVALRIEIEKRLRQIAERSDLPPSRPLTQLSRDLEAKQVLSHESMSGLRELVTLGNQAAHGVEVSRAAAFSAVEYGPKVLSVLDAKLSELRGASGT